MRLLAVEKQLRPNHTKHTQHQIHVAFLLVAAVPVLVVSGSNAAGMFQLSSWASASASSFIICPSPCDANGYQSFIRAVNSTLQNQSDATADGATAGSHANTELQSKGLVGAALDPAFGTQANQVGCLADYGYDTARDISRCATILTSVLSSVLAAFRLTKLRQLGTLTKWRAVKIIFCISALTALVHLLGTFAINNFGGLGAE